MKRPYHHGNLRATLIQAGLELIAEKGVAALTLREIGALIGVSRTAAYRHFSDKANLLAAIREVGFEKFATALESSRDQAGPDFQARFNAMGIAYVRFAREHPSYFAVMFGLPNEDIPAEQCEAEKRAFQILEDAIVAGQTHRFLRKGDARLMACTAWSMVHGICALKLDQMPHDQAIPPDEFVRACSNLLLNGLLADPPKK